MDGKSLPAGSKVDAPKVEKHVMISYQWEVQEFAKDLYNALIFKGFNVWMDTQGGMYGNIYDSMARAVTGAALVLVLETPEYEKSDNCKRECEMAATRKVPVIPLKLTSFTPQGWLATTISAGDLWFEFYERELKTPKSVETFARLCTAITQRVPGILPDKSPTIFLSFAEEDFKMAEKLCQHLEGKKELAADYKQITPKTSPRGKTEITFKCILPRQQKQAEAEIQKGESKEEKGHGNATLEKTAKENATLEKKANIESQIRSNNVIAVIQIITPNFEKNEDCKNEANLAYSSRKLIIPTVWQPLKNGFPPRTLEYCLKGLNYIDFTRINIRDDSKMEFKVQNIMRLLTDNNARAQLTSTITDKNFMIKNVGEWIEGDVTNWLRYINLHQYCQGFRSMHVNGRLLLSLTEVDLSLLKMTKLHQRIFFNKVQELFAAFVWTDSQVAKWLTSLWLPDMKEILYAARIDGKALLMLSESDLNYFNITNSIMQKRLLEEIHQLKLQKARVIIPDDRYRFSIIKDVLQPVASDQLHKFRFAPDMVSIFKIIITNVESNPLGLGLSQTSLKKFLFILLATAYIYKKTYSTKIIWNDATKVELIAIKNSFLEGFLGLDISNPNKEKGEEEEKKDEKEKRAEIPDKEKPSKNENTLEDKKGEKDNKDSVDNNNEIKQEEKQEANIKEEKGEPSGTKGVNNDEQNTRDEKEKKKPKQEMIESLAAYIELKFKKGKKLNLLLFIMEQMTKGNNTELPLDRAVLFLYWQKKEIGNFLVSLWLQYLTLDNITTRLFAVWDRMVNGLLSFAELLAGLDMLIYGSLEAKFKLAFSLVDYSGDGFITSDEQVRFYKECFVPVLRSLNSSNLVRDFAHRAHKQSVVDYIYQQVKDELEVEIRPVFLNPLLVIEYYNGGMQTERYKVENILVMNGVHCSDEGRNFDLVLSVKSSTGALLTNLFMGGNGASYCSSYLKTAAIWFISGKTEQDWKTYTKQYEAYNDFTPEQFAQLPPNAPNRPDMFISTDDTANEFVHEFTTEVKVSYIYIKFIHPWGYNEPEPDEKYDNNIDLEFLGFWGFLAEKKPTHTKEVPTLELYEGEGGIVKEETSPGVGSNRKSEDFSNFNLMEAAHEFLNAAKEVADGRSLPTSAEKYQITQEEVDALLKDLAFVEPEGGSAQINQAKTLQDLLPLIHLFGMFHGYDPMEILTKAM